ncbi:HTH-type transcriptional repressor PurR [subsurface metagenome]
MRIISGVVPGVSRLARLQEEPGKDLNGLTTTSLEGVIVAATIRDVAQKAGITISTASLVLNGKPNVSEETQQKVFKAAEELDYHPHIVSASE